MVLADEGFLAYPASTNVINMRLLAVEKYLRQQVMGQPSMQISRSGCPTLVKALGSDYRYRRKRDGVLDDVPEKSHPHSDVADALQYFCLGTSSNYTGRVMARERRYFNSEPSYATAPSSAGWT
jgi:hypothetical protein